MNIRTKSLMAAAAAVSVFGGASAFASTITYTVNETILNGGVTGTITTDGATGVLTVANFVAWNLVVSGGNASYNLTDANSVVLDYGTNGFYGPPSVDVTATATKLFFDYSGPDAGYLGFQSGGAYSGQHYWCNATHNQSFDCFVGESAVPILYSDPTSQYNTARTGNQVIGMVVGGGGAPEPTTWLMLLTGFAALGAATRGRRGATLRRRRPVITF